MIFIKTFGCGENFFKSQMLSQNLVNGNFDVYNQPLGSDRQIFRNKDEVEFLNQSRYFIVNTCTISGYSEIKHQIGFIRYITMMNKNAEVIVSGCSMKNKFSELINLRGNNITLIKNIDEVPKHIKDRFKKDGYLNKRIKSQSHFERFFVLLKEGCERRCSYCACSYNLSKKQKNLTLREIIAQIESCKKLGISRIEFGGACIGDWRYPNNLKFKFSDLIELILKTTNLYIGFLELHPLDLKSNLINQLAHHRISKEEISIPIQSASNRILKLMNRGYDRQYLFALFKKIYKNIYPVNISTDIIIGFPSESEKDITETVDFLQSFPLYRIDVYPYSIRKGTPMADYKVSSKVAYAISHRMLSSISNLKKKINFLNNEKLFKNR